MISQATYNANLNTLRSVAATVVEAPNLQVNTNLRDVLLSILEHPHALFMNLYVHYHCLYFSMSASIYPVSDCETYLGSFVNLSLEVKIQHFYKDFVNCFEMFLNSFLNIVVTYLRVHCDDQVNSP